MKTTTKSPLGALLVVLGLLTGPACSAYRMTVGSPGVAGPSRPGMPVFIEPFIEAAELEVRHQAIPIGSNTTLYRTWKEKPLLARPRVLRALHAQTLADLPADLGFAPTRALLSSPPTKDIVVVRLVVLEQHRVETNSALKSLACGLGFLCPPLWIYDALPVEAEDDFQGQVQAFLVPAAEVRQRMESVPGWTDPVFDLRGLLPYVQQDFTNRLHQEQGFLSSPSAAEVEDGSVGPVAEYLANVIRGAAAPPRGGLAGWSARRRP